MTHWVLQHFEMYFVTILVLNGEHRWFETAPQLLQTAN